MTTTEQHGKKSFDMIFHVKPQERKGCLHVDMHRDRTLGDLNMFKWLFTVFILSYKTKREGGIFFRGRIGVRLLDDVARS